MSNKLRVDDLPLDGEKRKMSMKGDRPVHEGDLPLEGSKVIADELSLEGSNVVINGSNGTVENNTLTDTSNNTAMEEGRGDGSIRNSSMGFSPRPVPFQRQGVIWKWIAFGCLITGILALVVGLSMTLTLDDEMIGLGGNGVSVERVKKWVLQNRYSSEIDLIVNSPQTKAMQFMASGKNGIPESSEEAEVKWMERYALSVFYYSTNGPSWVNQFRFHTNSLPTCQWFQNVPLTNGDNVPFGASCNSAGRVSSIEFFNYRLMGTIPTEIALLSELKTLLLQNNNIRGPLPSEMQRLTNLEYFDCLDCQELSGTIPHWIEKWTSLRAFGLTGNQFVGSIPTNIAKLSKLSELALDDNFLTGDLNILNAVKSLRSVYMERNAFTGYIDAMFLDDLENLMRFDISDNDLSGTVPVHLLSKATMQIMDIHDNSITEMVDSIEEIQESNVEFLAIHGNPISSKLPTSIVFLSNLKHFDATSTNLEGDMPDFLGDLTRLTYLFLADTKFNQGPIPESYEKLTKLRDFSVKDSDRTGTIPNWLPKLSNLLLLDLDSNRFTGPLPEAWPDRIEFLLVNRNSLNGTIPDGLLDFRRLQILWMDHNEITGTLDNWCATPNRAPVISASADCNGTVPLVTCKCCDICCDHSSEVKCHDRDRLAQYDPEWKQGYSRRGFYDFRGDYNITRS
mmetsp:Transcript_5212/g.6066  ORF Transcript_5212/g.6066 Transcript_5212/m.6066 type:complete len:679 (+) Transcript_5212:49-2085(+)|eukprot:CAMPEP_0194147104 /NCGR_PEP_ID=MMETSP0152-20130528/22521_1 /TAXON_ID=1049557 /ORGANISM="Thalassiothrix antarctica, Strain L6-D1" /LENGTH=678 /DNA_ID=CAMNT_0038847795 /DNA_START=61 /DNA_END=2097 /DNA_ORIENTATION=+